jgi:hypothetical protein
MISIKNLFFIIILFLATTTFSQKDEDIEYVFKKYIELNKNYLESMKLTDRKKLENYAEKHLFFSLEKFKNQLLLNFDKELFSTFLMILVKTSNSVDEFPISILGKIYIRYPKATLSQINLSLDKEKLLDLLKYGLDINCSELKQRIHNK